MKNTTRLLAAMLSFVMLLCFLPSSVLAQIGEAFNGEATEAFSDVPVSEDGSPYVLGEVEDRRTETSKTFRMSDGSYTVADYGKQIHFEDENGGLQDYDNKLTFSNIVTRDAEDFAGAVNAESDTAIKLANNSSSNNLLRIQKDGTVISLHLVGANKSKGIELHPTDAEPTGNDIESAATLHKFSSGAVYRDILEGVDLEYIILGSTVKENIIVKKQLDSYTFTFELKLNGLTPVLQSDGSIALNSTTSAETVMVIPKGVMFDSNGASSDDVVYTITHKNGNKYTLTVTADTEWMNAEERAFPITVDPTFTPADNGANTEDIQISDSGTSYSYTANTITVGRSGNYQNQMLIKAKTLPELPDSAVIVDARLRLEKASVTLGATIAAYTVTGDWSSSTVTWATRPSSSGTVIDYNVIYAADSSTTYSFDITKTAQYWYETGYNYGVLLAPLSNGGTGSVTFKSSDSSNKPKITVSYRDTKGIEGQWSYATQSAGSAGTGYINGFSGNLVFAHADMATEGSVIPITVSHVYNGFQAGLEFTAGDGINAPKTADYSNMKVGKGWKLSVQQTVVEAVIDNITYMVYNDSDGTERYFMEVDGVYVDEDGNGLVLTVNGTGEDKEYRIENETGATYLFDYTGKIIRITDVHGNQKRFIYHDNGSLYSINYQPVEVALEQQLYFSYNEEGALYRITNRYNNNDYVHFLYSETVSGTPSINDSGYLREIRYYNGTTLLNSVYYEYYDYSGIFANEGKHGALKSAKDGDTGYMLEYRYMRRENNFRPELVIESANGTVGQSVGFEYGNKLFTVVTSGSDDIYGNNDDIFTTTLFDDYGAAICSYSTFGDGYDVLGASYAEYMPYEAASETNYKVKTNAVKGITNNNLLYNPNCEPSSAWTKTVGGDGYSASYSTEYAYLGTGSLKFDSAIGGTGFAMYSDSVHLTPGTYTLSAYVKLINVSGNGGFTLYCVNGSEYKAGTTNTAIDNGWQRVSHTFTVTAANSYDIYLSLENASGTAYVDCVQLEKGEAPSDFNLVENGGFESAYKWSGDYTLIGGKAEIVGTPTAQKRITQTIALNAPVNTTFMLSGWGEADSVSLTTDENRKFGIIAKLTYSDNTTEEFELYFNPDNTNRQYASTAIVPNKTKASVTSVEISIAYDYNANTAYFDDIALTIEPAQTYAYDLFGNLQELSDVEGNESLFTYYDNTVDLKGYTAITGEVAQYTYNSKHQITASTKIIGDTTQTAGYTYDNYGNTTSSSITANNNLELKITSSAVYSDYGNYLTKSINELGKTTTYNYDSVTKLLSYIQNANNVHTAYTYDNRDRTTKVYLDADKDGIADTDEAQVAYLYANNRLSGIDTATTDYTLTYDTFGNVLTIKAGNYTLATYEYASNNGKLLKLTYGNGDYEEYVYDELERLVQTKLNGVTEYVVKYDNNGRLYSLTENGATHIYEYDSLDRLVRAWQEDSSGNYIVAVENSYDNFGRAKDSEYVVGDRTMAYEINYEPNSNLVDYILMPVAEMQSSISYTYDEFERVTRKQNSFSNALNFYEQYGYYSYTDEEGTQHTTSLVSSLKLSGNTPNTPTAVYTYTYDNLGNITQIKKDGVQISSYSYDTLGQLTTEIDNANSRVYNYTYDKSGNITRKTVYNLSTAEVIDSIVYTYGNTSWGDMLTAYDGAAITYDAIGNPTKWRNISAMTWEGRELQSATVTAGPRVTYEYNSSGIRTKKTLGSAIEYKYTLDGTKILSETATQLLSGSSYTLYYLYDASGSVQGFIYNNQYYYFQKNLQGDVIRILNSNGAVVTEYTYDAWGNVLTTTGSLASTVGRYNPFRYRSYYYDEETGLYYLQSRYYDPTVGRFFNADAQIGADGGIIGYNLYAYCINNPVNKLDPTGYAAMSLEEYITYLYEEFYQGRDNFGFRFDIAVGFYDVGYGGYVTIQAFIAAMNAVDFKAPPALIIKYNELMNNYEYAEYAQICSGSLSGGVQVGQLTYECALVIDEDGFDIQHTIGVSDSSAVGFSFNGTVSSAPNRSYLRGLTVSGSKSYLVVPTKYPNTGVYVGGSTGITPDDYIVSTATIFIGWQSKPYEESISVTWTW